MKKLVISSLLFFIIAGSYSQVTGYLGSRVFLSVNASLTPDYKIDIFDNRYDSKFRIRTPFAADLNFVASNVFSLGTRFSMTNVTGNFYDVYYDDDFHYSGIVNYSAKFFSAYLFYATGAIFSNINERFYGRNCLPYL